MAGEGTADAFPGAMPFLVVEGIVLALPIAFPRLTTYLPSKM